MKPIYFSASTEFQCEPNPWTPEHFFAAAVASRLIITTFLSGSEELLYTNGSKHSPRIKLKHWVTADEVPQKTQTG